MKPFSIQILGYIETRPSTEEMLRVSRLKSRIFIDEYGSFRGMLEPNSPQ